MAHNTSETERRVTDRQDRRKSTRGGRRPGERIRHWRRLAWLFAGYSVYVGARALSDRARLLLRRRADRMSGRSN